MTDEYDLDKNAFREAFLQGNARPDFIAAEFADVMRNLVRAVAADDPSGAISAAAQKMNFVAELLQRCQERVTWYALFSDAIADIQEMIPEDRDDRRYIHAAQRGIKYLVESSARDNAAAGRASRRFTEFLDSIEWADEARHRC